MAIFNFSPTLQNKISIMAVIGVLLLVVIGVTQVALRNIRGDQASAVVSASYLTQIGFSLADPNPNGVFEDSRKICQNNDGNCVDDGLIDYTFGNLVEKVNLVDAVDLTKPSQTVGGLVLSKNNNLFNQNGTITSKNYIPKSGKKVSLTKIQIGVGLKPENLLSMGYSIDSGANFTTAIANFTADQLKAQENQTVIEYNFPTPTQINQGFAYKIALKADNSLKKSPSLKFVRIFYTSSNTTTGSVPNIPNVPSSGSNSPTTPTIPTTTTTPTTTPSTVPNSTSNNTTQNNSSFLPTPNADTGQAPPNLNK